ncbi:ketoacyl-ACP synthase III family protein [Streptomyces coeruleorubidus]|uniref:ketoacyl-ACP synthase III family protein n=1 Tax=Streptomyces coeruleorubidus TaxID=116188 RepID=UPI0037AD5645
MKWNDVYIAGTASYLCAAEDVQEAVASGRYDPAEAETDEFTAVRVARADEFPAQMAAEAGARALRRSGLAPDDVVLVASAHVGFQGLDLASTASYVQGQVLGRPGASAVNVGQASNGGMAALDLAAACVAARPGPAAALVTTGDKFTPPQYDRYRTDSGIVLADGATGLVLARGGGAARLLSSNVISDAAHEGFWRGDAPWTDYSDPAGWPVNLTPRKDEYLARGVDLMAVMVNLDKRQQESMDLALAEAGVAIRDVARFVYPHVGSKLFDWDLMASLGIERSRTTFAWGSQVGHLGAGDQIAGLNHLLETRAVRPGDKVVLVGTGGGWSFGSAVLEIQEVPEWTEEENRER